MSSRVMLLSAISFVLFMTRCTPQIPLPPPDEKPVPASHGADAGASSHDGPDAGLITDTPQGAETDLGLGDATPCAVSPAGGPAGPPMAPPTSRDQREP